MSRGVIIAGVGSAFPEKVKRNSDFDYLSAGVQEERVRRGGVQERRWSGPSESNLDLAERACRRALASAGVSASEIDRLLLVTSTMQSGMLVPAGAVKVQDRLGVKGVASTVLETCCGSILAMDMAVGMIRSGQARHVLVVASETFSKTFNPSHAMTFEIGMGMGDGAAAVVLSCAQGSGDGWVASFVRSSSDFQSGLGMRALLSGRGEAVVAFGQGSCPPTWQGRPLSKGSLVDALQWFTSTTVPAAIRGVLAKAKMAVEQVDFFVLHQPNRRFLEAWKTEAGIPEGKTLDTLSRLGNLSSVSVLANLDVAWRTGRIARGDHVVLAAAGEGAVWGSMLWKWEIDTPTQEVASRVEGGRNMSLQDRVAIVAGGSKGIGRAVSKRFADEGATVVVVARDAEAIERTLSCLGTRERARGIVADCTKPGDVQRMVDKVVKEFGSIHMLVNTVGGGEPESVAATSDELFDYMIDLNVRSAFLLSRAVAPWMTRQGCGSIVHTASIGAKMPSPGLSVYDGCKAFVVAFTRDLALELGRFGVNVNCVCPGHVPTEATEKVGRKIGEITGMGAEKLREMVMSRMAIQRFPEPEEIAGLYLFLVSPAAACMTGQAINYSCGMEMR